MAEAIATAVLNKARKGDVRAFEAVANRAEGKAPQTIESARPAEGDCSGRADERLRQGVADFVATLGEEAREMLDPLVLEYLEE